MAEEPPLRAMLERLKLDMNKVGLQSEYRSYIAWDEVIETAMITLACLRVHNDDVLLGVAILLRSMPSASAGP